MAYYDKSGNLLKFDESYGNGKTFVFLGDSIPAFDSNTGGIGSITDYMAQMVGGTWKNFAIGGTTLSAYRLSSSTYDMFCFDELADSIASGSFANQQTGVNNGVGSGSTRYSAQQKVTDMAALDWASVDTICLHFGTNDIAYGVSQIGTASDSAAKNGTLCAALAYGAKKIHSAYQGIKIVYCGILFRNADGAPDSTICADNLILEECCKRNGIRFVDMHQLMCVDSSNYTNYLYDGTHPKAAGKQRYAEVLAKHLY